MPIALRDIAAALEDRFRVEKEIGSGGWAVVYLAEDLKIGREVAIKVLRPELATDAGAGRFQREIDVAANLRHPHLLPLLDSGFAHGFFYYVMPRVEGESLRDRIAREGPLPIRDAVRIGREVADALAYAHARGVVHRDVKPGNVMLESGHAVVTDFGIAAVTQTLTVETLTDVGTVPGTPHYMAPEQVAGETDVDGRTDVYALGCVLYEMLAGEPPIAGTNAQLVLARKLAGEIPRLRVVRDAVPESLERVVHRALARVPADRFQDAGDLGEALGAIETAARLPVEVSPPGGRPAFRERIALAVGGGLGAFGLVMMIGFLATAAFDLKVQFPEAFGPSRSDYLLVGLRALIPVLFVSLLATGVFLATRLTIRRVGATLTRVSVLDGLTRAIDRNVVSRVHRLLASAGAGTVADAFFVGLIAVSVLVLIPFGRLLSVLWSTETEILSCAHKPLHRAFMIAMVLLIVGSGTVWARLFPRLRRRMGTRGRLAAARWGSLAWIAGLLVVLSTPWRIINDDAERLRLDGRPAYLLDETDARLLVFDPGRGFTEAIPTSDEGRIERLRVRGYLFEGRRAFDSGAPRCASFNEP